MNSLYKTQIFRFILLLCLLSLHGPDLAFGDKSEGIKDKTDSTDPTAERRGMVSSYPIDRTAYRSENPAEYSDVPLEMISLNLVSIDPVGVTLPGPGQSTQVDSFFDVFTEISINDGLNTRKEAFFDVFIELEITNRSQGGNKQVYDTEILSMSLTGDGPNTQVIIRESPSQASTGKLNIGSSGEDGVSVDSFFDIWTEISIDRGKTWYPALAPQHLVLSFLPNGPTLPNGTSLLPPGPIGGLPLPGSRYRLQHPVSVAHVGVELSSLCLVLSRPINTQMLPKQPGETTQVDSFFDIYTEISVDDGQTARSDSFFDVFVELSVANTTEVGSTSEQRSFDTEILSMDLKGASFPDGVLLRESKTQSSTGQIKVVPGEGGFSVDSFFDIWTEISLDGGQSWVPANKAMHMPLVSIPETPPNTNQSSLESGKSSSETPTSGIPILQVGNTYLSNNRTSYAKVEIEMLALNLISTDPGNVIPLPQAGQTSEGDAFFDIFTEIQLNQYQSTFIASFFDVFTDLSLNDSQSAFLDSFFDIFAELNARSEGPAETLSGAHSFVTFIIGYAGSSSLTIKPHAGVGYDMTFTEVNFVPLPEIDDEVLVGFRHSPDHDTQGSLRVSNIGSSGEDGVTVDSFFDIWTEISIDGGQSWMPTQDPARLELSLDGPSDPVTLPEFDFPMDDRTEYTSVNNAGLSDVGGKIVRLSLRPSDPNTKAMLPLMDSLRRVDSFFDVFAIVEIGNTSHFFQKNQVPVSLVIMPIENGQEQGTWETEILSMSLRGNTDLGPVVIRESQMQKSRGRLTVSNIGSSGEDGVNVDSFFDIWTEISIDGGQFIPAGEPIRVALAKTP